MENEIIHVSLTTTKYHLDYETEKSGKRYTSSEELYDPSIPTESDASCKPSDAILPTPQSVDYYLPDAAPAHTRINRTHWTRKIVHHHAIERRVTPYPLRPVLPPTFVWDNISYPPLPIINYQFYPVEFRF